MRGKVFLLDSWVDRHGWAVYILCGMASADPVIVVPYDEAWPSLFEAERTRIEAATGPWVEEIEHVGSTAVHGLAAKPVIDIMVGVRNPQSTSTRRGSWAGTTLSATRTSQ